MRLRSIAIILAIGSGACSHATRNGVAQPASRALNAPIVTPAAPAAGVVSRPSVLTFGLPDPDMALTVSFRAEVFLCNAVSPAGDMCLNRAQLPAATVTVAKSAVTGLATARTINMAAPSPFMAAFDSLPGALPHVITLVAVADPAVGGISESPRSEFSSPPFYPAGRTPAAPTGLVVK